VAKKQDGKKGRKVTRQQIAWSFYDWANSGFATSILAFIYVQYFVDNVAGGQDGVDVLGLHLKGSTLWPLTIFVSFLLILIISPILGAVADNMRNKKAFLAGFTVLGVVPTGLLFFVMPGDWAMGVGLFILANMGFVGSVVFYNALMKDVARQDELGFVSGLGWGMGYVGGFILLIVNILMIFFWHWMGFESKVLAVRSTFVTVAVWWSLFSLPLFLVVKEKGSKQRKAFKAGMLVQGAKEVVTTLRCISNYPVAFLFLGAFFLFNDAIETTISQATNFATSVLDMGINQILIAGLLIQFVAIFGSFGFLWIEKRVGTKRTLVISLVIWLVALSWALFMRTWVEFYIMAGIIGLVLGVSQSAGRTMFGMFTPRSKSAQFFSFYGISGKVSSLIGPLLFAFVDYFFNARAAVIPLWLMMAIGLVILFKVNVDKGVKEAKEGEAD
jgi:UMF1 family MFS transporter